MGLIDQRTLLTVYFSLCVLCCAMLASLWKQNRRRYPETLFWFAGFALQVCAVTLIIFRGVIPDLLSIVVANTIIIASHVLILAGLRLHAGLRPVPARNIILLAAFALVHAWFTYVHPDLGMRNINLSAGFLFVAAQATALVFWQKTTRFTESPRSPGSPLLRETGRSTGLLYAALGLAAAAQIAVNLLVRHPSDFFRQGPIISLLFLLSQLLTIALAFSLFLLITRCMRERLEAELAVHRRIEHELKVSEEKFERAFQTAPYSIIITRLSDSAILDVNDHFVRASGWTRAEAIGSTTKTLGLWVREADRDEVVRSLTAGIPVEGKEIEFRMRGGELVTCSFSAQTIQLDQGPCILSCVENIDSRKRMENELRQNQSFLSDVIEHNGAVICVKDIAGGYKLVNRKWEEAVGKTRDQVLGKTDEDLFPPAEANQFRQNDLEVINTELVIEKEEILQSTEGSRTYISIKFPLRTENGTVGGVCGIFTDITERKKNEERIRHLADHDLLTDLPTLRLARDRLSMALNLAHRNHKLTAVMFIDLDGFKAVNDQYGHDAGDQLLREIARRIESCLRETDTAARIGGDEFLLIATELSDTHAAARIAEKVISLVSRPVGINQGEATISASVGIALAPADGEDPEWLVRKADAAMYAVKKASKNGYAFVGSTPASPP